MWYQNHFDMRDEFRYPFRYNGGIQIFQYKQSRDIEILEDYQNSFQYIEIQFRYKV